MQAEGIDHVEGVLMTRIAMDAVKGDVDAVIDLGREIQAKVMIAVSAKIAGIEAEKTTDATRLKAVAQKRAMTKLKQIAKMQQHLKRILWKLKSKQRRHREMTVPF